MNYLAMASRALEEHQAVASMAYAVLALTHYQTYPERPPPVSYTHLTLPTIYSV